MVWLTAEKRAFAQSRAHMYRVSHFYSVVLKWLYLRKRRYVTGPFLVKPKDISGKGFSDVQSFLNCNGVEQ